MKMIKVFAPQSFNKDEDNVKILQPGIDNSKLVERVELKDTAPYDPIEGKNADIMIIHGSMPEKRAMELRDQHPDIPAIILEYKDNWKLEHPNVDVLAHFKRSTVVKEPPQGAGRPIGIVNYPEHNVHFSPFCVREDIVEELKKHQSQERDIDVSCFFEPQMHNQKPYYASMYDEKILNGYKRGSDLRFEVENTLRFCGQRKGIATALSFARDWYGVSWNMHIGKTKGEDHVKGRRTPGEKYCEIMSRSKIIVTACPEGWEGDYRLMEAMSSGALVIHNEMLRPPDGLMNKQHWVTYRDIPEMLEKVYYYMRFPEEAKAIGEAGRNYVLNHHRPHHRLEQWLRTVSVL